jgi:hypothetical protein
MRRSFLALGLVLPSTALWPLTGRTGAPPLELNWQAPAGCPDGAAILRYITKVVGNAEPPSSALHARVNVARLNPERWMADLTVGTSAAEESARTFEGPTCEAVSEAAALVIALAVHPGFAPGPGPSFHREPEPATLPDRSRGLVAAAFLGDVGSVPTVTYGGELAVRWTLGGVRWEPFGAYFKGQRGTVPGQESLGAQFTLIGAGLRGCAPLPGIVSWLAPCLGGGLDWMRAAGFGSRIPRNAAIWSSNVRAGVQVSWGSTALITPRFEAEAVVPLARPEFVIEGAGHVHREGPVVLRVGVGMELHF